MIRAMWQIFYIMKISMQVKFSKLLFNKKQKVGKKYCTCFCVSTIITIVVPAPVLMFRMHLIKYKQIWKNLNVFLISEAEAEVVEWISRPGLAKFA